MNGNTFRGIWFLESFIRTCMHIYTDTLCFSLYVASLANGESVKKCVILLLPLSLRSKPFLPHRAVWMLLWMFLTACDREGGFVFPTAGELALHVFRGVTPCGAQGRSQTVFKWTPSNPCCVSSSLKMAVVFNCWNHVCFKGNWFHMFVHYLDWAHHIVHL